MKKPLNYIAFAKGAGILVTVVFLFVIGYQIAVYTNDAPDVSALSQENTTSLTITSVPVNQPDTANH